MTGRGQTGTWIAVVVGAVAATAVWGRRQPAAAVPAGPVVWQYGTVSLLDVARQIDPGAATDPTPRWENLTDQPPAAAAAARDRRAAEARGRAAFDQAVTREVNRWGQLGWELCPPAKDAVPLVMANDPYRMWFRRPLPAAGAAGSSVASVGRASADQ